MNNFLNRIRLYIDEHHMLDAAEGIVVGLSGGADSVCLLRVLCSLAPLYGISTDNIVAVHVNHMIRGDEADCDESFAARLCESLNVSFEGYRKDITEYARELGSSVEEAGRIYRYECFNDAAGKHGADKIAVAHNKNDMAETVIFNMIRGSGLKGMAGIPPVRDNIIRPLLCVDRTQIEEYLAAISQDYRTDSTNLSTDYDRNKIRHVIIPCMENINKKAVSHICDAAYEASKSHSYIHSKAVSKLSDEKAVTANDNSVSLDIPTLYKMGPVLQEHAIFDAIFDVAGQKKDIGRKHIMSAVALIYQDTGKQIFLPYGIKVRRSYDKLIVSEVSDEDCVYNIELGTDGTYIIPKWGSLVAGLCKNTHDYDIKKTYTKMVDYGKIKGNLCIRTPQDGDYIIINSKGNTKKLSRVFIDQKIDREKRDSWPVIACGNEVIWAIGLRYNEAYRIDDKTEQVLVLEYEGREG